MGIEDILSKAHHKDISEHGGNIQEALEGIRLELLTKHYGYSLSGDKKEEWNSLTPMERNIRLAKNDYILPEDQAEDFVNDVVYSVLHGAAPEKANEMKKNMDIIKNPSSTPDQKRDAHKEIGHFLAIANSYGIRMDYLNKGKAEGFGPGLFRGAVRDYGETYVAKERSYWLNQIGKDEADEYLGKISGHDELKDFNTKLAKDAYLDEKRHIISSHYASSKNIKEGGYDAFKKDKDLKKYFKK